MENISFFDIVESFFEQINPINHYELYNNIYQEENINYQKEENINYKKEEKSLFEVIKSFFDDLYGYNLYDDE
jgi:hypothetical protein